MFFVLVIHVSELNRRTAATLAATLDDRGVSGLKERSVSDHAFDFLQSWIVENVNATMPADKHTAEHLAQDCVWEARTRGITKANLVEAAGGDLDGYIVAELSRAVDHVVENGSRKG